MVNISNKGKVNNMHKILITLAISIFFSAYAFSQEETEEYIEYHYDENFEIIEGSGSEDGFFTEDHNGHIYFCPIEDENLV